MKCKNLIVSSLLICLIIMSLSIYFNSFIISAATSDDSDKILIPHKSWNCGMPEGIPNPESGTLAFEVDMKLDQIYNVGRTQYGQRQVYVVKSGTISGSKIKGTVMSGGLDLELNIGNRAWEIEQFLVFKTNDGKYIFLRNAGTGVNQQETRVVMNIEAPNSGSYSWMNTGKYVAKRTVDTTAKTMKLSIYDVSKVSIKTDSTSSVEVNKPVDIKYQSWDYRKASGEKKGSTFITENVTLGSSQSVGATKNGINRNIIPITGGSVTGSINAKILNAGADYQNITSSTIIDAKYLWQTNDGEIIIVRNAGSMGSLVPTFETKVDGKYASINDKQFLSSDPGLSAGGVNITFYESKK